MLEHKWGRLFRDNFVFATNDCEFKEYFSQFYAAVDYAIKVGVEELLKGAV